MSICLIDTSVFCELIAVPNLCKQHQDFLVELRRKVEEDETLLLPMATILETGNHIGQNGNGTSRRQTAQRFVHQVHGAISGQAPFTPTPLFTADELVQWLSEFPDWAQRSDRKGKGSGLGDLSIMKEFNRQCLLHPSRRIYIWSKDMHLQSYDTAQG
jgi:hypothetical protein